MLLALAQVVLSVVLSYKKKSRVSRTFIYFTSILFIWTLVNGVYYYLNNKTTAIFSNVHTQLFMLDWSNRAGFFTGTLTLVALYRLLLVFPVEQKRNRLTNSITLSGVLLAFLALTTFISGSYSLRPGHVQPQYTYGILAPLILVYFIAIAAISTRSVVISMRKSADPIIKAQTKTILSALLTTALLAIFLITILPLILHSASYIFLGYFAPYIFTTALFYSIFRQRFLNFQSLVARSIGYTTSVSVIILLFSLVAFGVVRGISGQRIGTVQTLIFAAFCGLAALSFQPIKSFFDKLTNKIFFRDIYDPQMFIDSLNQVLIANVELYKLLSDTSLLVSDTLKAKFCAFSLFARDKEKSIRIIAHDSLKFDANFSNAFAGLREHPLKVIITDDIIEKEDQLHVMLRNNNIEIAMAIMGSNTNETPLGYLILGPKQSGNPYSTQDLHILQIIVNELVLAIQNALRFEQIQNFNRTLEARVEEATKELQEANSHLKELDKVKDDFLSMATHQLGTPLIAVDGYLSMVDTGVSGPINPKQHTFLDQARYRLRLMQRMVADFLDVSRMEVGRFVIEPTPVDLNKVVAEEVDQLQHRAHETGVILKLALPPQPVPVTMLDEQKTRQAIMNLVDNAIHYTPKGQVNVYLQGTPKDIVFQVVDNGIGVPPAQQGKLFSKYYRADNAKAERPNGNGIGLYLVKRVVEDQGGNIIFKSEEGKGSTFGFRLPLKISLPKPQAAPPTKPTAAAVA